MKKAPKLTPKQQAFVAEYLVDLNATQAAIRAGYSEKGADVTGPRLLGNVRIAASISEAQQHRATRTGVTQDRIVDELSLIAFSDMGEVLDFTGDEPRLKPAREISPRARRAISSVKVKRYVEGHGDDAKVIEVTEFKFWPKTTALELLGRHTGGFDPRLELTGKGGTPLLGATVVFGANISAWPAPAPPPAIDVTPARPAIGGDAPAPPKATPEKAAPAPFLRRGAGAKSAA